MEVLKDQMTSLLENGLYDSAQMLGCFPVSSAVINIEASPYTKAKNLVLHGDALFGEKEFRRALSMYKQALQDCKIIPKQATNSRTSLSTSKMEEIPSKARTLRMNLTWGSFVAFPDIIELLLHVTKIV